MVNDRAFRLNNLSVSSHSCECSSSSLLLWYFFHGNCSKSSDSLVLKSESIRAFSARHELRALRHFVGPSVQAQSTMLRIGCGSVAARLSHVVMRIAASTRIAGAELSRGVAPRAPVGRDVDSNGWRRKRMRSLHFLL